MNIETDQFDWGTSGSRPFGVSERQMQFVQAILKGCNQTQAAKEAGYEGGKEALATTGHRTMQSPKVRALLAAVQDFEGSTDEPIVTSEEILQILSKEARTGVNPTSKIKSLELLEKYHAVQRSQIEETSDLALVESLENSDGVSKTSQPIWAAIAVLMARDLQVTNSNSEPYRMKQGNWTVLQRDYKPLAVALDEMGLGLEPYQGH